MSKNYIIIALIVVGLVSIALLAKMPAERDTLVSDFANPGTFEEESENEPHLHISDQIVQEGIVIDSVNTNVDSWISIHPLDAETASPNLDALVGLTRVQSGFHENIIIPLEETVEDGVYFALLSEDGGVIGEFEQSLNDSTIDPPITRRNGDGIDYVHMFFRISNQEEGGFQAEEVEVSDEEASESDADSNTEETL